MKFLKQTKNGDCDIIAIEDIYSFLHEHHSKKEIKERLKRHDFGTWLPEIGHYLEKQGIKTKLISNDTLFISTDEEFTKELNKYKKKGTFEDRIPTEKDIKNKPVIINVDAMKILGKNENPQAHYIVALKEDNKIFIYDGMDKNKKEEIDFQTLYSYSLNISNFLPRGMWLFLE